jgi:hypothetical protein
VSARANLYRQRVPPRDTRLVVPIRVYCGCVTAIADDEPLHRSDRTPSGGDVYVCPWCSVRIVVFRPQV